MSDTVSILIPTYNRKNLLKVCLQSVLSQSYKNLEIIVIDDASSDPIDEIVNNFQDPRIRLIKNKKKYWFIKRR